jgi:hypothetical protein
MNHSKKKKELSKMFWNRVYNYSFFLLSANKLPILFYGLLLIIEFLFLTIIPLENLIAFDSNKLKTDEKINFVLLLSKESYFFYITDVINALVYLSMLVFLFSFIVFNKDK